MVVKRRRFAFAISLAFVAAGALLIATGETAIGLMSVLFFGGGALVLGLPLLNRTGGEAVRRTSFDGEPAFLFPISRLKQGVVVLAGLGMGAAGVLIALAGGLFIGVACAVFFGGVAVIGLVSLRGERGLFLTPRRIVARFNGEAEIAWEDLASVEVDDYGSAPFLTLVGRVHHRRGAWLARLNRRLLPASITLPANSFVGDPQRIVAAVAAYREDERRREWIGMPEEHARLR